MRGGGRSECGVNKCGEALRSASASASIVQRHSKKYETNCSNCSKSTKIGTHVDKYILNNFGYGGIQDSPRSRFGGHFEKWPLFTISVIEYVP